ncbi:unnamed protein product, partial [Discosporangium mesarthrocarpum]
MHRGLRPLEGLADVDDGGAGADGGGEGRIQTASQAVEDFVRKNMQEWFNVWMAAYTTFSLDPKLVDGAKAEALKAGVDLDGLLLLPAEERAFGDGFVYHLPALETLLGMSPPSQEDLNAMEEEQGQGQGQGQGVLTLENGSVDASRRLGEISSSLPMFQHIWKACTEANRTWSLAEAQAESIHAFRLFIEVCVLRRQPGYHPYPLQAGASGVGGQGAGAGASGESGSDQGEGAVSRGGAGGVLGEVSPARTPL